MNAEHARGDKSLYGLEVGPSRLPRRPIYPARPLRWTVEAVGAVYQDYLEETTAVGGFAETGLCGVGTSLVSKSRVLELTGASVLRLAQGSLCHGELGGAAGIDGHA